MSHTMKIWERIIDRRLRMIVEKYRDGQRELHCAFIDLEKAYERVPREEVWNCLSLKNMPQAYIKDVQEMCDHKTTQARCGSGVSEKFETKLGVQQGSALSPFLFAVVMDWEAGKTKKKNKRLLRGRYEGDGGRRPRCPRQAEVETEDKHRRPTLVDKPGEEEEEVWNVEIVRHSK